MADIVYTSSATAKGGREGSVKSDDANVDLNLVKPGSKKEGTNPEQLFAAGYASCFDGALNLMASNAKKRNRIHYNSACFFSEGPFRRWLSNWSRA